MSTPHGADGSTTAPGPELAVSRDHRDGAGRGPGVGPDARGVAAGAHRRGRPFRHGAGVRPGRGAGRRRHAEPAAPEPAAPEPEAPAGRRGPEAARWDDQPAPADPTTVLPQPGLRRPGGAQRHPPRSSATGSGARATTGRTHAQGTPRAQAHRPVVGVRVLPRGVAVPRGRARGRRGRAVRRARRPRRARLGERAVRRGHRRRSRARRCSPRAASSAVRRCSERSTSCC